MTTNTTREGFERWAYSQHAELQRYPPAGMYVSRDTEFRWMGYQAAKADELAFLEGLVRDPQWLYSRITDRIAVLKGESRG